MNHRSEFLRCYQAVSSDTIFSFAGRFKQAELSWFTFNENKITCHKTVINMHNFFGMAMRNSLFSFGQTTYLMAGTLNEMWLAAAAAEPYTLWSKLCKIPGDVSENDSVIECHPDHTYGYPSLDGGNTDTCLGSNATALVCMGRRTGNIPE